MNNPLKKWSLPALLFIAMAVSVPAHAIPLTGNSVTGNGIVWTLTGDAIPGVDNTGSFTLAADVSGSTLGTAYLGEFSLKNFGSGSTASISNLVATAGSWNWVNQGLNAKGCKTIASGTLDALCVFNDGSDVTAAPSTLSDFSFTFDITLLNGVFPDYTHLKVRWLDAAGDKVGDLISKDITWREVPEPGILALLGIGLAGMGLRRLKLS